jgi:hypothetical protein
LQYIRTELVGDDDIEDENASEPADDNDGLDIYSILHISGKRVA